MVLRDATLCKTVLCHIDTMLQKTTACYIIRHYTMLHYIMLCYTLPHTIALLYNEICYILDYAIQYDVIAQHSLD